MATSESKNLTLSPRERYLAVQWFDRNWTEITRVGMTQPAACAQATQELKFLITSNHVPTILAALDRTWPRVTKPARPNSGPATLRSDLDVIIAQINFMCAAKGIDLRPEFKELLAREADLSREANGAGPLFQ
jgi:hypothetical protein